MFHVYSAKGICITKCTVVCKFFFIYIEEYALVLGYVFIYI